MIIEYHSFENYDYAIKLLNEIGYNVNSQKRYNVKTSKLKKIC